MAKKNYIGVSGAVRPAGKEYIGVSGVARKVKKGYVGVNGVARQHFASGMPLSTLAVGSTVRLRENGVAAEYLVVQQGVPCALYDASCDGTWLLRKELLENHQWHSASVNNYAQSDMNTYLNGEFLACLDANVQSAVKRVRIKHATNIMSASMYTKIFLLGGYEVGFDSTDNRFFFEDGARLAYFDDGTGEAACSKRIARLNGSDASWWLRSADTGVATRVFCVYYNGSFARVSCTSTSYGVRPAFVLPGDFAVEELMIERRDDP